MLSEARQKKIMEKLNRAQKCSILGPQNLGSGGAPPGSAPDIEPIRVPRFFASLLFCTKATTMTLKEL